MPLEIRSASAGTGKTTSLVRLYVEALQNTPARRIAAVTFTRASARDLRKRLRAGLEQLLESGQYLDLEIHNRQNLKRALLELDSSVISTIHGFFRQLLRLNAPSLGLDPDFVNLDEPQAKDLFRAAASQVLARAALEGGAGTTLLAEHGWEEALEALEGLHQKRVYAPFSCKDSQLLAAYTAADAFYQARLGNAMLSATDVELYTLRLLEDSQTLERIRQRFFLLLVDEFQDVNPLQAQIFTRLGLARIVFVGDAKQSIYAFRDADVGAFLAMYDRAKRLTPLTTSYRHGQRLAKFYSSLAEALFPDFSDLGLDPNVTSGRKPDAPSSAELHLVEAHDLDGGRSTEARILCERLHQLHQTYPWREMAILLKTRTSLNQLEPSLRAAQIPFLVGAGQRYYDRREIRDAMLLLRAKLQPNSPEVLASLARLPSINLELAQIERLFANLREALAQPEFAPLRELLAVIASASDALSLLEAAWMHLGTNLTREAQSYANLDGLLYQLAARGARDPRAALNFLERARLGEAEGDEPLEGQDAVRILTVHASKGLEFAVCAVYDLARGERNPVEPLVVHPEGEVAWRSTPEFVKIQAHWNRRRDGEANRLLYVALTRAKDVLLMTGSSTGTPRAWLSTLIGVGLENLHGLEVYTHTQDQNPSLKVDITEELSKLTTNRQLATSQFKRHALRVRAPTRAPVAGSEPTPDEVFPDFLHGEATQIPESERVIGTLAHYAIGENFSSRNPAQRQILGNQYVLHPYTASEREAMLEAAWWYLGQYERLYPDRSQRLADYAELAFAYKDKDVTWQGIIDRLYQLPDGNWVLEDYKTDSVPRLELHERAKAYERQMLVYLEAVRRSRGIEPEVRITFLHHLYSYCLKPATPPAKTTDLLSYNTNP